MKILSEIFELGWSGVRRGLLLALVFRVSLAGLAQVSPMENNPETPTLLVVGKSALRPTEFHPWLWLAAALVPAVAAWAVAAAVWAERSESTYSQRRAYRALGTFLRRARRGRRAATVAELETWCALTGKVFAVSRAAPTDRDFAAGLRTQTVAADAEAWMTLWWEARAALFAAQRAVPSDWVERAEKTWAATRIKRTASRWPIQRRHWWPVLSVVILVGGGLSPSNLRAAAPTAEAAWARGETEAAREAWLGRLATKPDDWGAQHNVALAYQREELWGAATAHWVAALVANPREPAIVAGVQRAVARMEGVDPTLQKIVAGKWHERAVTVFSPGEWQLVSKLGAVTLGLAALAGVVVIYHGGASLKRGALTLGAIGALGVAGGAVALARYGVLANPAAGCLARAADLRAVPSELVEQEKTAPLLAGQLVVIDGHYFGWTRIVVRSGAVGWVRREAVWPLYEAQAARGATGFDRETATR